MARRIILSLSVLLFCLPLTARVRAGGYFICSVSQPRTLRERFGGGDANAVVIGTPVAVRQIANENGTETSPLTFFKVENVISKRADLTIPKIIKVPRAIDRDPKKERRMVLGYDIRKGKVDAFAGLWMDPSGDMPSYLAGVLKPAAKDTTVRLRHCAKYLGTSDPEVAADVAREFDQAEYRDYRDLARNISPATLMALLRDPAVPDGRKGLYATLLGHCGGREDAVVFRTLLALPETAGSGREGLLIGYVLLDPTAGWKQVEGDCLNESVSFMRRYAALRAARFFWSERPDVISHERILAALRPLLDQGDIADLLIDDLRKWKNWGETDRILALWERKSHDIPIMRRSILRYALRCPKPAAKAFLDARRAVDAQSVKEVEELLRFGEILRHGGPSCFPFSYRKTLANGRRPT